MSLFAANETADTSVTIVRVASPTPSMHEEMEEEDKQRLSDLELLETLNEGLDAGSKKESQPPRVGVTIENYYPPDEAKSFVAEVLSEFPNLLSSPQRASLTLFLFA